MSTSMNDFEGLGALLGRGTATVRLVGGRIICPESGLDAVGTLDLSGEAVLAVHLGTPPPAPGALVLDAGGMVVAPGFIDLHAEVAEPGHAHREPLHATLAAAVRGGFTRICAQPGTDPPLDRPDAVRALLQRAGEVSLAGVLPVAALTLSAEPGRLAEIYSLADAGAAAFGMGDRSLDDAGLWRRAIEYARAAGRPIFEFPEDAALAGDGVLHEGTVATRLGLPGVSAAAEDVRVWRAMTLAEQLGISVHIGPITTHGAARALRQAHAIGLPVTAAASIAHLHLTDADVAGAGAWAPYDPQLRYHPSLRTAADRDALRVAVAEGWVESVTGLHRPRAPHEKAHTFQGAAPGAAGLATALGLMLRCADEMRWPFSLVISRLSLGPAQVLRRPDLGRLSPGARADVVVFDPSASTTIEADPRGEAAANTPWLGHTLPGRVRWTLVDGRVVYDAAAR